MYKNEREQKIYLYNKINWFLWQHGRKNARFKWYHYGINEIWYQSDSIYWYGHDKKEIDILELSMVEIQRLWRSIKGAE